jgi:hypothetical protein
VSLDWERGKTLDESRAIVKKFFDEKKITVPTYIDVDATTIGAYGVESFPTTLVVDPEGVIRYRNVGFHPMSEEIFEAQIRSLLPKKG